jgi:FkbM family methyltransferase
MSSDSKFITKHLSNIQHKLRSFFSIQILHHKIQNYRMRRFYAQFVGKNTLCFDVGANIGNRTRIFLQLGANVVAIEPQDTCVQMLRRQFGNHPHLQIVQTALGEKEYETEIKIDRANTISSMNPEWIQAVKNSGRFANHQWESSQTVNVTTLDNLIAQYGIPDFIKIDVEGYEEPIIRGLSTAVPALSIEFVPELLDPTIKCIDHLIKLGDYSLNYALGESMVFEHKHWLTPQEVKQALLKHENDISIFGDIYLKRID